MDVANTYVNELRSQLDKLGYNKWARIQLFLEFAILEALLWEVFDVRYVGTSGSEYPSLPSSPDDAYQMIEAARDAKRLAAGFVFPQRRVAEGYRTYLGRAADRFEEWTESNAIPDRVDSQNNGSIAADQFVQIALRNRTHDELEWPDEIGEG